MLGQTEFEHASRAHAVLSEEYEFLVASGAPSAGCRCAPPRDTSCVQRRRRAADFFSPMPRLPSAQVVARAFDARVSCHATKVPASCCRYIAGEDVTESVAGRRLRKAVPEGMRPAKLRRLGRVRFATATPPAAGQCRVLFRPFH